MLVATPAIHHSDRGVQYAATAYIRRLQALGVTLSMAATPTQGEGMDGRLASIDGNSSVVTSCPAPDVQILQPFFPYRVVGKYADLIRKCPKLSLKQLLTVSLKPTLVLFVI